MNRLTGVIISFAFLGLLACSEELSDVDHVNNAQQHIEKREFNTAIIELKNALQKNGANPETRYLLGKVYLELGDPTFAEIEIERALDLGLAPNTALPTLAKALLLQQKFDEVLELALADDFSNAAASELMVTQGLAQLALGNLRDAETLFAAAQDQDATSTYAMEGAARLQIARREIDESRQTLETLLELDKKYAAAWSLLGQIEQAEGNLDAAEAAYLKAIELSSTPVDDLIRVALLRLSRDELDAAEVDINRLEKMVNDHIGVIYARGVLLFRRGDYEAAQDIFDKIVGSTDQHLPSLYYAGATHLQLQHQESAERNFQRFLASTPNHPGANLMLATIKLRKGEFAEAERLLTLTLEETPEDPIALSMLSRALISQGRADLAVETLQELISLQPENAANRVALGHALYLNGNTKAGTAELQAVMTENPELPTAPASLVRIYLATGKRDEALETAKVFLDQNKESQTAYNLLASTYLSLNEDDLAKDSFAHVLEKSPGDLSANGGMAALAMKEGKPDEARNYYIAALEGNPGHFKTLLNLATLELAVGNREQAQQILRDAAESNPDSLEPLLRLGATFLVEGRAEDIPDLLGNISERHPDNVALLTLLADSARANLHHNEALQVYQKIARLTPLDPNIRYQLARSYAAVGDRGKYREELSKTLELNPYYYPARLKYTSELITNGHFEEAQEQINILAGQNKSNTDFLLLKGQLAEAEGNTEQAILIYEDLFKEQSNNINLLRLTSAKWTAGERQAVVAMLEHWLADYPNDILIQLELGNRYINLDREAEAIAMLEVVVSHEGNSKIPMALNNLAWLLHQSDLPRALAYAEEAYTLNPKSAAIMDTLSMLLLETGEKGQVKRAARLNERAQEIMPKNPTLIFHSALIQSASGNKEEAREILEQLLDTAPDFPERQVAVTTLQSLHTN